MRNFFVCAVIMLSIKLSAHETYTYCSVHDLEGHSIDRMTVINSKPNHINLQDDFQGYVVDVSFMGLNNEPFISVWPKGKRAIASAVGSNLIVYEEKNMIQVRCF